VNQRFRPRLEGLEGREVPASFDWSGLGGDGHFDNSANWKLMGIGEWEEPHGVPLAGDDLRFLSYLGNSPDCIDMHGAGGAYNSVTIASTYTGTVSLSSGFTTGSFVLQGSTIDQPSSGTDITVTSNFHWTGGTLNSRPNVATLTISGRAATGLIAPDDGGTIHLGSNLTIEGGAVVTMEAGSIDLNKDGLYLTTLLGSSFFIDPGAFAEAVVGVSHLVRGEIWPDSSWRLSGAVTWSGTLTNTGTFTPMPESTAQLSGNVGDDIAYLQGGHDSATYLYGGSFLVTLNKNVRVEDGLFATIYASENGDGWAVIVADTFEFAGGNLYLCYGTGLHNHFGDLQVAGDITWTGGTYHPYVYTGGVANDVWQATNNHTFWVDGGMIAPVYLDSDYGTSSVPNAGDSWMVLKADGGFTNSTAPSLDDSFTWRMQIDGNNPPKYWKLIAN